MREIDAQNAQEYLIESGRLSPGEPASIRELTGGVSNIVLRVDQPGHPPLILKQCRERLRVKMDWHAPLERIWVEVESLELLSDLLPTGSIPQVLFTDKANYLFAMSCASEGSATWKEQLMAGDTNPALADRSGTLLATLHNDEAANRARAGRLADTSLFEHLRIDPYYRTVAIAHPDLKPAIDALIQDMQDTPSRRFVHGDYSPKNMLVDPQGQLMLLDFECAHAGDPAFDLGFFFTHLILKASRARFLNLPGGARPYLDLADRFWASYTAETGINPEGTRAQLATRHLGACLLARLDGKSPVEYRQELDQDQARQFARLLLLSQASTSLGHVIQQSAVELA